MKSVVLYAMGGVVFLFLQACKPQRNVIRIKGSDTEVNLVVTLAEAFHASHQGHFISISGGGSGLGIASLINGTADIANSSRSITQQELELFHQRSISIDSFVFAQDALAFIVSEQLALDSISLEDLARVLSGEFDNWQTLTGHDLAINIYGRQSNSGTHEYVKHKLKIKFSPYAKEMNGNAQILEAIKADPSGIGYVGAGYVARGGQHGLRALRILTSPGIKAISPLDTAMVAERKYFFQRPLYQYFKSDSYDKLKPFLSFENSANGKEIIRTAGYYLTPENGTYEARTN